MFVGALTQDTAGEQIFIWGTLVSESWSNGTKEITGIKLSYHVVTANTGSIYNISLQEITSSLPANRPTGIPLAQWSGSVTSSTFVVSKAVTHTFTSSYSVAPETKLGVLFKYDAFASPTALNVRGLEDKREFTTLYGQTQSATSGSTWTISSGIAVIQFLCSDGSVLFFKGIPNSIAESVTVSSDYTPTSTGTGIDSGDERGMLWIPKKTYDINRFTLFARLTTTSSIADFTMYRDTTVLASKRITPLTNRALTEFSSFDVNMIPPIRVFPNDNIRFTTTAISSSVRHARFSFENEQAMKNYLGGDSDEINFSFTNRVDGGAWNTPPSASYSFLPLQIYGTEVVGNELLSGSLKISGSVEVSNVPVSGARIFALRQSDGAVASTTSSVTGTYQFNLTASTYHVFTEYETVGQKYNALSYSNIQPA